MKFGVVTHLRGAVLSQDEAAAPTAVHPRAWLISALGALRIKMHSTLSFSSGELTIGQGLGWRVWGSRVVAAVVIVSIAVGGTASLLRLRRTQADARAASSIRKTVASAPQPAAVSSRTETHAAPQDQTPTVDPLIEWKIKSDPPGAAVTYKDSAEPLGQTPLSCYRLPQPGQVVLVLERVGYQPIELVLATDSNCSIDRRLVPLHLPKKSQRASGHRGTKPPDGAGVAVPSQPAPPEAPAKKENGYEPLLEN